MSSVGPTGTKPASDCGNCGADTNLTSCSTCSLRFQNKGTSQGICAQCITALGAVLPEGKYTCAPCKDFLKKKKQEALLVKLAPSDPRDLLRTASQDQSWVFVIAQASPEAIAEGIKTLKRKLNGHKTVASLAESLSTNDPQAGLVLGQLAASFTDASKEKLATNVLTAFVNSKCATTKFKTLLLPPSGSLHVCIRHLQDLLGMEDPLVVALAEERIWICRFFETYYRPPLNAVQKKKGEVFDLPLPALQLLRATFKSMSHKAKCAAQLCDSDLHLFKALYGEHMDWGSRFLSFHESASPYAAAAIPNRSLQNNWAGGPYDHAVVQSFPQPPPDFYRPDKNMGKKGAKGDGKGKADYSGGAKRFAGSVSVVVGQKQVQVSDRFRNDILIELKQSRPNIDKLRKHHPEEVKIFFNTACPNCFVSGKGLKDHLIGTCAKSGAKCNLLCIHCGKGNHWFKDCQDRNAAYPSKPMPLQAEHIGTEWAP